MVVTDAAYEQRAMNFVECGLYQPAQVMAILAVVEQLKIMNENTKRLEDIKEDFIEVLTVLPLAGKEM